MKLPDKLKAKKAIVNMKNKDQQCFKWCVTRALNPVEKNAERVRENLRQQSKELCWRGISFPTEIDNTEIFERKNNDVSVNVFGYDDVIYPLRIAKEEKRRHVDLLLLKDEEKTHFCWTKNFNKLVSSQVSKNEHKRVFCKRCLNPFTSEETLAIHKESCEQFEAVRIGMPKKGSKCKFKNMNRTTDVPFRIYVDFELILKPLEKLEQNEKESFTVKYQKHIPCGYCFHTVSSIPEMEFSPIQGRANHEENSIPSNFIRNLISHVRKIQNNFKPKKMIFKEKDRKEFERAVTCWLCGDKFGLKKNERKVCDHCHYTGKYCGAAHSICNLHFKKPNFTPVFFHSLANYDAHLLVKNLGKEDGIITCIPNNEENIFLFPLKLRWERTLEMIEKKNP